MRKRRYLFAAAALCLMLAGCGGTNGNAPAENGNTQEGNVQEPNGSTEHVSETKEPASETELSLDGGSEMVEEGFVEITLYYGNANADGFDTEIVTLSELTPENIIAALAQKDVVPEETEVLSFSDGGEQLTLDLSAEFEQFVSNYGTAGEYVSVGGVVNTFLEAYDAEHLTILVEGNAWSSGHADYEAPLGRFE